MLLHARAGGLVIAAALVLTACESPVEERAAASGGAPPPRSVHIHASELAGACDGNSGAVHAGDDGCAAPPLLTPTSSSPVRYPAIEELQASIRRRAR